MLSPRRRSIVATTLTVVGGVLLPLGLYALAVNGYVVLIVASFALILAGIAVGKAGKRK